ncbi:MAG: hypothetical protein A2V66_11275 [Ignavibacteria bacterium RBG_13_36_8]|nr:MAG: hypothetical protein A2V66_11275 [Ignavibacteria bacterium RBG_13_36_8]
MKRIAWCTIICVGIIISCKDTPTNEEQYNVPTPFDNTFFSGYGTYDYVELWANGRIGENGVIEELNLEDEGSLQCSGGVTTSGDFNVTGTASGGVSNLSVNFTGRLIGDSLGYTGSGTWSGTVNTNSGQRNISGTWSISGSSVQEGDGDFLAWTGSDDPYHYFSLVRVNKQNGMVTNIGGNDFFTAMAYSPNGTLYGIASGLHIINPENGSTIKIGDFQYNNQNYMLMSGASFSPNGTLFVMAISDSVFTVNLSDASLTYVGKVTDTIWDIEFSSSGTLYASFANLFVLDPYSMTTLSTLSRYGYYISSISFDLSGNLFGIDIFPSTYIYSININTGNASTLVQTQSDGLVAIVAERVITSIDRTTLFEEAKYNKISYSEPISKLLAQEKEFLKYRNKKLQLLK